MNRDRDEESEDERSRDREDESDSGKDEERQEFVECRHNLRQLFEEQLSQKSAVYLLTTGIDASETRPTALNFRKHKQRCGGCEWCVL